MALLVKIPNFEFSPSPKIGGEIKRVSEEGWGISKIVRFNKNSNGFNSVKLQTA